MRGIVWLIVMSTAVVADERFAERAPPPHIPKQHTAEAAGINRPANHAVPGVSQHNVLGYTNEATFGMDYTLFSAKRPNLVMPGLWPWGRKPASFSGAYATESKKHIPDVFALQPFRRAVKEAKLEKKGHGE